VAAGDFIILQAFGGQQNDLGTHHLKIR